MIRSHTWRSARRVNPWITLLLALLVVLAAALAVSGCGAVQTAGSAIPDTARITLDTPGAAQQAWTVTDSAKVRQLHTHILALTPLPSSVDRACQRLDATYTFVFLSGDTHLLDGTITQCSGYIQLSDRTTRGIDEGFWPLVNAAVGKDISPQPHA